MNPDVLVIGAGPAGAVTARELARRGVRVLLVDKAKFPRPKVCGCCLNGVAVGTLRQLGLANVLADGIPLNGVVLAAERRSAGLRLPSGLALSRTALDSRLADAAVDAGVEFRSGTTVRLPHDPAAGVTIVASGLTGGDAAPETGSRIGAGVMLPAEAAPAFFAPGTIYMAVGRGGYVGLVRVEGGQLDVAAAFDAGFVKSAGGPGPAAEAVLGEAGLPVPSRLAELPWKGTPALTRRPVRVAGERWFAVGDAAGYVEPFTGEGMAWAVASAVALAPIAARAADRWEPALAGEWERIRRRILGRRQLTCRLVARALRYPTLTRLAVRLLSVCPTLARPLVAALNHPLRTAPTS